MPLALATLLALAQACAPDVAPETLLSVARAESGFDPLVIGVNSRPHQTLHPSGAAEAARVATALLAQGRNLDLGLTQINGRNLPRLGLSVSDAFDPCRNLAAGARILSENYAAVRRSPVQPQTALKAALSVYNTGHPERGIRNGYVGRVYQAAARVVPAIQLAGAPSEPSLPQPGPVQLKAELAPVPDPPTPTLDVFARADRGVAVWSGAPLPPPAAASRQPANLSPGEAS